MERRREENASALAMLPARWPGGTLSLERPQELEESRGLVVEGLVEARNAGEARFGQRELPFCDSSLHAATA